MEDIVTRLRDPIQSMTKDGCRKLMNEAANEIERAVKIATEAHDRWEECLNEIDKLRAALAPLNIIKRLQQ